MIDAPGFAWDSCTLLNLVATGRETEILNALPCPSCVVRDVREQEVLYIRSLPEDDPARGLVAVDLSALIVSSALLEEELTSEEQVTFVKFATQMDDGEARTLSLARHRRLWVMTDDRVSLRVAREEGIMSLTTPEWIKLWADNALPSAERVADALRRIEMCASYAPRRSHPLRGWWDGHRSV